MKAMNGMLLVGAIALCGLTGGAEAATFKPSGRYAFTAVESCEAKFGFTTESVRLANGKTDTGVRMINSQHNGHIGSGIGYITFKPTSASAGTYTLSITNIHGGALRVNNGGVDVKTDVQSFGGTYSFTATTFTFNSTPNGTLIYRMAYGALNSVGLPSSVHFVRQDSSGETTNCVQAITATH
jgi:hypothetical protein